MNAVSVETTTEIVPFFTDTRSISERLACVEAQWMPTRPEEKCPTMIAGLLLERGIYVDSKHPEPVPTLRILTRDNVEWSVIAFHGYLRGELDRKRPCVGDFVALAFRGTKPATRAGESDSYIYTLAVERNPDAEQAQEPVSAAAVGEQPDGDAYEARAESDHGEEVDDADSIPF
jgi:hypothetical protein